MSKIQHWKQIDFQSHIEDIRAKRHWWDIVDVNDIGWSLMMNLIDSHPKEEYDWNREKQRLAMNKFHFRESAPHVAKDIVYDMREFFSKPAPKMPSWLSVFVSLPSIESLIALGCSKISFSMKCL